MMETLLNLCRQNGIDLSQRQLQLFENYLELLLKWNRVYNLTSVRKRDEIAVKHFFDSLTLVRLFEATGIDPAGKDIADFGSGAGFPGVPVKIYYPQTNMFLIESTGKKCMFLETLKRELKLDYTVLCQRAEQIEMRFDIVLSRATGETFEVLRTGKKLLKEDGILVVMKGKDIEEELKNFTISIPFKGFPERKFVVVKKHGNQA